MEKLAKKPAIQIMKSTLSFLIQLAEQGAVYIRRKLYMTKIKVLRLSKYFDNKSEYYSRNPPNFPDDLDKKRLKTTKAFMVQGRLWARVAASRR